MDNRNKKHKLIETLSSISFGECYPTVRPTMVWNIILTLTDLKIM